MLDMLWKAVLCLGLFLSDSLALKAAVYEHVQQGNPFAEPRKVVILKNLLKYFKATRDASEQGADMIVLPEGGIMFGINRTALIDHAENIPDPAATVNPCREKRMTPGAPSAPGPAYPILSNLSCMAQDYNIYLVANMADKKPCLRRTCHEDNLLFYNTNVAFDRTGTLISRYHKNHLFIEPYYTEPDRPEYAVFGTDFGRKVGMFTCFDIIFREASELVTRFNIDLAVMTTWWYDELPGWFAVAVQQAWSLRHNVTLLAADIQRPNLGSVGSGIYLGRQGPLLYTSSVDGKDKLLVADLEGIIPNNTRYVGDKIRVNKRVYIETNTSDHVAVALKSAMGSASACDRGFCCSVRYSAPAMRDNFYLLVKRGIRRIKTVVDLGVEECLVTRCEPRDGLPCSHFPITSKTSFTSLELQADFAAPDIFPTVVSDQVSLTSIRHWHFNTTAANRATLALNVDNPPPEPLLSVVLTARIFHLDSPV